MSSTHETRLGELDSLLDSQQVSPRVAEELFALVDLLEAQPALRRALTDTGAEQQTRAHLVDQLFGGRISEPTHTVLHAAVVQRWPSSSALLASLERQAVRATLSCAQQDGTLERVEDELFRFSRLVEGDRNLQAAVSDRSAPLQLRRQLVDDLLAGRADSVTNFLAKRAVGARNRSFGVTVEGYLTLAAALRSRTLAHVVVARPMTAEQTTRLAEALSGQMGRQVSLQVVVDPNVIGGVRVTVGDHYFEGTVAGRLENARRQLS